MPQLSRYCTPQRSCGKTCAYILTGATAMAIVILAIGEAIHLAKGNAPTFVLNKK